METLSQSQLIEDPWPSEETPKKSAKATKVRPKIVNDADSYRIIGIVNHLGTSSNSGHYISDVLNLRTKTWLSYDDRQVEHLSEEQVLSRRVKTGYIFFYIHK